MPSHGSVGQPGSFSSVEAPTHTLPQFSTRSLPSEEETALCPEFVVEVAALMISDLALRSFFDLIFFFFGSIKLVHSQIVLSSSPVRIKEIPQPSFILSHFLCPFRSNWHCICWNNLTSNFLEVTG